MFGLVASVISTLFLASVVNADTAITCGGGVQCPESSPCCSQYGQCGVGAYCLGGCDPVNSHSLNSCMPAPVCKSQDYKLTSLDGITPNTEYLGDATKSNWVSSGEPVKFTDSNGDQVLLTMAKGTVGTLLASTSYVWFGKVSATMKTSRTQGVVTAFILLADSKDEIDFEFVGTDLATAQSNYYYQGIPIYTHELNLTVSGSDTFSDYHTYEIDWTPDTLTWSIDGTAMRTLHKSDTWNATSNQWMYPQTPARIQLSLWPAGLSTNQPGTIEWAGGLVNWNAADVQNAGYFYAMFNDVSVTCYDPPSGAQIQGTNAYVYNDPSLTNSSVVTNNDNTVLASFLDSGLDPNANAAQSSGASGSSPTQAATVPGLSGPGVVPGGTNSGNGNGNGDSSSASLGSTATGSSGTSPTGAFGGFSQGSGSSMAPPPKGEKALRGSMLAVLMAIVGMLVM